MDIRMPRLDGITATNLIAGTAAALPTQVVMLTTCDLDEYALAVGASGFFLKDVQPEELVPGVRLAAGGDAPLEPSITQHLITESTHHRQHASQHPSAVGSLTVMAA